MRRNGMFFVAIMTAGIILCAYSIIRHDKALDEAHAQVRVGMPAAKIEQLLGEPDWQGPCGARMGSSKMAGCEKELGYGYALAPIMPAYVVVYLDINERVISDYMFVSP